LKSYHTFNFANFYDEQKTGFGKLLVLNDNEVQQNAGFGTHTHDNMEIISIPLSGRLSHKDNFGNEYVIGKGDVQVISAGTGMRHSEFNISKTEPLHFLEIWILPDEVNRKPLYQHKHFEYRFGKLIPIIRPDGKHNSLTIFQNVYLYLGKFRKNSSHSYSLNTENNGIFVMVLKGKIFLSEETLHQYDALGIDNTNKLEITFPEESDILLMELPMQGP
jgi:redox-sensitive bicupin YhaK (pirin superfamily)